jgi:hypothetical protein
LRPSNLTMGSPELLISLYIQVASQ